MGKGDMAGVVTEEGILSSIEERLERAEKAAKEPAARSRLGQAPLSHLSALRLAFGIRKRLLDRCAQHFRCPTLQLTPALACRAGG